METEQNTQSAPGVHISTETETGVQIAMKNTETGVQIAMKNTETGVQIAMKNTETGVQIAMKTDIERSTCWLTGPHMDTNGKLNNTHTA